MCRSLKPKRRKASVRKAHTDEARNMQIDNVKWSAKAGRFKLRTDWEAIGFWTIVLFNSFAWGAIAYMLFH